MRRAQVTQVPAARRKAVDFILSKVEPREGLSGEEQDPSGRCVVKAEVRGAGVRLPGAAVQVGGGDRVPELPGGRWVLVLDWRCGRPGYPGHGAPSFLRQPDFQTPIPALPEGQPERSFLEEHPGVLFGSPGSRACGKCLVLAVGEGERTREGLR